jgi:farnesyl-diphosphate farnesyltransferase
MNQDFEWVSETMESVSRTFSLSLSFLPDEQRQLMEVSYLLCRVPDTIEDSNSLTSMNKKRLLGVYRDVFVGAKMAGDFQEVVEEYREVVSDETADWQLVFEFSRLFEIFMGYNFEVRQTVAKWVVELTRGMKLFTERYPDFSGVRIQSFDELDEYCYYVAGVVGHLIVDLIEVQSDIEFSERSYFGVHMLARKYGLLLQYVNVTKDVYADFYTEDSIYIPAELVTEYFESQEEVVTNTSDEISEITAELVSYTDAYIDAPLEFLDWIQSVAPELYTGWAIPYFLSIATLREVLENPGQLNTEEEVKIDREMVARVVQAVDTVPKDELKVKLLNGEV